MDWSWISSADSCGLVHPRIYKMSNHKIEEAKKLLTTIANSKYVKIDITVAKRPQVFDVDGAESKYDFLEISFGGPDQKKVLLDQRSYSVKKICVPETVQYTVAFLWFWHMIDFLRFGLVADGQIYDDAIEASYTKSCIEILGLLFT